jgi:hypothetical protein
VSDLDNKAHRVVQAITDKGPELTLAVHEQLKIAVTLIALPWDIHVGTSHKQFTWHRRRASDPRTLVRITPHSRKGLWLCETVGEEFPRVALVGSIQTVQEGMDKLDQALTMAGFVLLPGRPTAAPWTPHSWPEHPETPTPAGGWLRRRLNGAPDAELARVSQQGPIQGSNWYWMITKLAGPGPTDLSGPWATAEAAMEQVDKALRETGWIVP